MTPNQNRLIFLGRQIRSTAYGTGGSVVFSAMPKNANVIKISPTISGTLYFRYGGVTFPVNLYVGRTYTFLLDYQTAQLCRVESTTAGASIEYSRWDI